MKLAATIASIFILVLALLNLAAFSQTLPSEIRGYKVYETKIVIVNEDSSTKNEDANASIHLLKPKIVSIGLTGVTVEVVAEITPLDRAGRIYLMTFKDFRVNSIPITIDEFNAPFDFKKGEKTTFTKPARVSINTASLAKGAYKELVDAKEAWVVSGTVFVFGKFKKFGIGFKRVIPVKIELKIKNLLH